MSISKSLTRMNDGEEKGECMTDSTHTPLTWRKSTWSNTGDCVEVAVIGTAILVRDSKNPTGPVLSFTLSEWASFMKGAHVGEFG